MLTKKILIHCIGYVKVCFEIKLQYGVSSSELNTLIKILLFFSISAYFSWTESVMTKKLSCFANSLSRFVIFAGFLFTGFKYLTKRCLKHSLS